MYDDCGRDHCNRLTSEVTVGPRYESERMELALWLWEVHNDVNARLMTEGAARQNREVTDEEIVASRFPTMKMCPECWLDGNMTRWDREAVFRFIDDWYWPKVEPIDEQFKSVIARRAASEERVQTRIAKHHGNVRRDTRKRSGLRWSRVATGFASISFLAAFALLFIATLRKKRSERRKKFVDSRFERKKPKGCLGL